MDKGPYQYAGGVIATPSGGDTVLRNCGCVKCNFYWCPFAYATMAVTATAGGVSFSKTFNVNMTPSPAWPIGGLSFADLDAPVKFFDGSVAFKETVSGVEWTRNASIQTLCVPCGQNELEATDTHLQISGAFSSVEYITPSGFAFGFRKMVTLAQINSGGPITITADDRYEVGEPTVSSVTATITFHRSCGDTPADCSCCHICRKYSILATIPREGGDPLVIEGDFLMAQDPDYNPDYASGAQNIWSMPNLAASGPFDPAYFAIAPYTHFNYYGRADYSGWVLYYPHYTFGTFDYIIPLAYTRPGIVLGCPQNLSDWVSDLETLTSVSVSVSCNGNLPLPCDCGDTITITDPTQSGKDFSAIPSKALTAGRWCMAYRSGAFKTGAGPVDLANGVGWSTNILTFTSGDGLIPWGGSPKIYATPAEAAAAAKYYSFTFDIAHATTMRFIVFDEYGKYGDNEAGDPLIYTICKISDGDDSGDPCGACETELEIDPTIDAAHRASAPMIHLPQGWVNITYRRGSWLSSNLSPVDVLKGIGWLTAIRLVNSSGRNVVAIRPWPGLKKNAETAEAATAGFCKQVYIPEEGDYYAIAADVAGRYEDNTGSVTWAICTSTDGGPCCEFVTASSDAGSLVLQRVSDGLGGYVYNAIGPFMYGISFNGSDAWHLVNDGDLVSSASGTAGDCPEDLTWSDGWTIVCNNGCVDSCGGSATATYTYGGEVLSVSVVHATGAPGDPITYTDGGAVQIICEDGRWNMYISGVLVGYRNGSISGTYTAVPGTGYTAISVTC